MPSAKDTDSAVVSGPDRRTKSDETTRRLLEAAGQEFRERGYEGSRVSEIARRADLTTGAVYARWPHKPDVLAAALDHVLRQALPVDEIEQFGSEPPEPAEILKMLRASRLGRDEQRDVMVQAFGSARNNEVIGDCLLRFLNEESRRLGELVELGKEQGVCDPAFSTAAITLLWHSVALGAQLLVSAGLDEDYVPDDDDWTVLLWTVICAICPGAPRME